jgi:hypothetical protein
MADARRAPATPDDDKTTYVIGIRVPKAVYDAIAQRARLERRSMSDLCKPALCAVAVNKRSGIS